MATVGTLFNSVQESSAAAGRCAQALWKLLEEDVDAVSQLLACLDQLLLLPQVSTHTTNSTSPRAHIHVHLARPSVYGSQHVRKYRQVGLHLLVTTRPMHMLSFSLASNGPSKTSLADPAHAAVESKCSRPLYPLHQGLCHQGPMHTGCRGGGRKPA